jgi:hypothetical protein
MKRSIMMYVGILGLSQFSASAALAADADTSPLTYKIAAIWLVPVGCDNLPHSPQCVLYL